VETISLPSPGRAETTKDLPRNNVDELFFNALISPRSWFIFTALITVARILEKEKNNDAYFLKPLEGLLAITNM
jgi:hypothetical protein